jgi:ABC-2 type transport system ATP-binding protein
MNMCIEVEHLKKHYGSLSAVNGVSFSVNCGEIFGLLGQNGAGKTTIVECLQGLRHADAGHIRVLGLNPATQAHALRRRIGCQLQESALPDRIKVWEALSLFSSLSPTKQDWRKLMVDWGLAEKAKASFASLSGGQRQRLFVALALVNNPEIVFLDEMTTGFDPAARHLAWELIRQIRARGTTVIMVTHFMDEAEELCDRLVIIDKGLVVAQDSPRALIARYAEDQRVIFTTEATDLSWLKEIDCVDSVEHSGQHVTVYGKDPVLALVAASLVNHGIVPSDLHVERPSLEDVFLNITGHAGGLD